MTKVINLPLDASIKSLVESDSITAQQKTDAILATVRECNEERIIEELKKMNKYFAIITDQKL